MYRFLASVISLLLIAAAPKPEIRVDSIQSQIDKPIAITVNGLQPKQTVTLKAKTQDEHGVEWSSYATLKANSKGSIDLRRTAPISGTYQNEDGMGLFWSMQPSKEVHDGFSPPDPQWIELSLESDGKQLHSISIQRLMMNAEVIRVPVSESGLVGTFFYPKKNKVSAGVIILGGSQGGLSENKARTLAAQGFATLALAYFAMPGLPEKLEKIPLEYFEKAHRWMQSRPEVYSKKIGLIGSSRGGELSLILASHFPSLFQAVAAYVPTHVTFAGLPNQNVPAWTYKDTAVAPLLKIEPPKEIIGGQKKSDPVATSPLFMQLFAQEKICAPATIPVEKIKSPLLLISGEDDKMWPSFYSATRIVERIQKYAPNLPCKHLHYPSAGHFITQPYLPTTCNTYYHPVARLWMAIGGTPQDDAFAAKDSWNELIRFLRTHLSIKD